MSAIITTTSTINSDVEWPPPKAAYKYTVLHNQNDTFLKMKGGQNKPQLSW